ncbi:MAG TPA: biopolymer transporter ExbD [Desulfurivibrionaceae bacterium]|nr:biopolymer transporter ExbD [Desulfurivibrionaceae bacterium]
MDDKTFDSINVIPLVDVMLVLLTIVLTTSTFIATGAIPVTLPKATASSAAPGQSLTVAIDKSGRLFLGNEEESLATLRAKLEKRERNLPVLIRADKNIALQLFVEVMDVVKGLGFNKISLQTETTG